MLFDSPVYMSRMQVDVDVHNDWAGGNGSSLTPEIYHLLCQKDKEELDDPRTRRQVLSRLKLEELFDHDDLEELELFAIREERKREQERSLEGANLKDAVIQRFLQQRTPQEIEEDERIMQQEVREAIEDAEAEAEGRNLSDSDEDDDYEQPEYDADLDIFVRVAFLAILERRLEDEERHRREEAEERTREESPQLESEERRGEERSQSGLEESREERRRRRLERLAEIEEEIVVLEPNSNNEPNAVRIK